MDARVDVGGAWERGCVVALWGSGAVGNGGARLRRGTAPLAITPLLSLDQSSPIIQFSTGPPRLRSLSPPPLSGPLLPYNQTEHWSNRRLRSLAPPPPLSGPVLPFNQSEHWSNRRLRSLSPPCGSAQIRRALNFNKGAGPRGSVRGGGHARECALLHKKASFFLGWKEAAARTRPLVPAQTSRALLRFTPREWPCGRCPGFAPNAALAKDAARTQLRCAFACRDLISGHGAAPPSNPRAPRALPSLSPPP